MRLTICNDTIIEAGVRHLEMRDADNSPRYELKIYKK